MYTSKGWPLTNGSCGKHDSTGVNSVEEAFRELPVSAMARALARGLIELRTPEAGEAKPEPVPDPLLSDAADIVRGPIGTVRFCKDCDASDSVGTGCGTRSGSGGASAAGTGRPRAAAMSWCSAQLSDQSLSPRQNGASFRSIYYKKRQLATKRVRIKHGGYTYL